MAHWHSDPKRTEATIVDVFAHESTHMRIAVLDIDAGDSEENIAYLAGTCAKLDIVGYIRAQDTLSMDPRVLAASEAFDPTLKAHFNFEMGLYPLFDTKTWTMEANTPNGRKLAKRCEQSLTALFKPKQ